MKMNREQRIRTNLTLRKTNKDKIRKKDYNKERTDRLKTWTDWFK